MNAKGFLRPIRPTALLALQANQKINARAEDPGDLRTTWQQFLNGLSSGERQRAETALATAYDSALSRQLGLEGKAVGVVQAAAIVVAALIYGATGPLGSKIIASLGLCYLGASLVAAGQVLFPRSRATLTARDVREGGSQGIVEMGQVAELMSSVSLVTSNWVTASVLDLGRAAVPGVVAVLLTVFD